MYIKRDGEHPRRRARLTHHLPPRWLRTVGVASERQMVLLFGGVPDRQLLFDAARRLAPDVIVTDISVPVLNGIEASKQWNESGLLGENYFLDRSPRCRSCSIQAKEGPGQISALYPHIQPALEQAGCNLEAATKVNAKLRADLLREASTVISSLLKEGKVVASYYDIASGTAILLD